MSSSLFTRDEVGMSSHRLALAYGEAGHKKEAQSLLQAALDCYEQGAHYGKNHPLVVVARDSLNVVQQKQQQQHRSRLLMASKQTWSSLPSLPISTITEDSHHNHHPSLMLQADKVMETADENDVYTLLTAPEL
jgi:hypothetical protein